MAIANRLGELRRKSGLSAAALASACGTSRQTVYAIEAGAFVPNTLLALKLGRTLETRVEDLFPLPEEPVEPRVGNAALLPGSAPLIAGQPVRLCRVDRRLIALAPSSLPWHFPAADGVFETRGSGRNVKVRLVDSPPAAILMAGCDPATSLLARRARAAGVDLALAHRNSSQGLALLKEGCIHIAGTHLRDDATGESNLPAIRRAMGRSAVAVITYATWEEGILTAKGNPKRIRGVEDFARADVCIVNREAGAGSRRLLDSRLHALGVAPRQVRGYTSEAQGHLAAAWQVRSGAADACVAPRSAARFYGLGFVPLADERYDLVLRRHHLDSTDTAKLFEILTHSAFRRELATVCGYDTHATGSRIL